MLHITARPGVLAALILALVACGPDDIGRRDGGNDTGKSDGGPGTEKYEVIATAPDLMVPETFNFGLGGYHSLQFCLKFEQQFNPEGDENCPPFDAQQEACQNTRTCRVVVRKATKFLMSPGHPDFVFADQEVAFPAGVFKLEKSWRADGLCGARVQGQKARVEYYTTDPPRTYDLATEQKDGRVILNGGMWSPEVDAVLTGYNFVGKGNNYFVQGEIAKDLSHINLHRVENGRESDAILLRR